MSSNLSLYLWGPDEDLLTEWLSSAKEVALVSNVGEGRWMAKPQVNGLLPGLNQCWITNGGPISVTRRGPSGAETIYVEQPNHVFETYSDNPPSLGPPPRILSIMLRRGRTTFPRRLRCECGGLDGDSVGIWPSTLAC